MISQRLSPGVLLDQLIEYPLPELSIIFRAAFQFRGQADRERFNELINDEKKSASQDRFSEDALLSAIEVNLSDPSLFSDLVIQAESTAEQALLAAAHRFCRSEDENGIHLEDAAAFRARDLNSTLTSCDAAITNISNALDSLLSARPRQIRPSGEPSVKPSPRAQLTYRLTRAGLERVKRLVETKAK